MKLIIGAFIIMLTVFGSFYAYNHLSQAHFDDISSKTIDH